MTHIDRHTVIMEVEYHRPESRYAPITKITRRIAVDGRTVHTEETLSGSDPNESAAAKFERWCIDAELRSYPTDAPQQAGLKAKKSLLTMIKTCFKPN